MIYQTTAAERKEIPRKLFIKIYDIRPNLGLPYRIGSVRLLASAGGDEW